MILPGVLAARRTAADEGGVDPEPVDVILTKAVAIGVTSYEPGAYLARARISYLTAHSPPNVNVTRMRLTYIAPLETYA